MLREITKLALLAVVALSISSCACTAHYELDLYVAVDDFYNE